MKACTLVGHGLLEDDIFSLESACNRDGCNEPYVLLAEMFRANGYAIHTQDRITSMPAFAIHMNVQDLEIKVPT